MSLIGLREVLKDLTSYTIDADYEAVREISGEETAVAFAVGKNCVDAVALAGDDDWLAEIIRYAYERMSSEGQSKFAETGF